MRARLRLLAAMLAVVLFGYAVGAAITGFRLPGVELPPGSDLPRQFAGTTSPSIGSIDAPVTVLIFTDYRCAVCQRDHEGIARVVASEPRARYVFKEWAALGPASEKAARLALAADMRGHYLAARDTLMRGRRFDEPQLGDDLVRHRAAIDAELSRVATEAFALGLPGTPAYVVGRRLVIGSLSERQLRRLIARAANVE